MKFKQVTNEFGEIQYIETSLTGQDLLTTAKLNKGTAFTQEERAELRLLGKLPHHVETLDEQADRLYLQYIKKDTNLQKNIYLRSLHNHNETLFYKLLSKNLKEMLPVIYTPTVGEMVEEFSREFRRPRGLYISYPDRHRIDEILESRLNPVIDLIVMTDGEAVLGIGDQGIGGMEICIAKLNVYVLCGGINPARVLPIQIDVGTNNEKLLNDPMYLGWRHERLSGEQYDEMIDLLVAAIRRKFPNVFLHWEDFGRDNARRCLERYQKQMCTFNDDMQGTGVVTLAALLSAVNAAKMRLSDQKIVIFGAGTAGVGIADQVCDAMVHEGLTRKEAQSRFWLINRQGLLTTKTTELLDFQKPYLRPVEEMAGWSLANGVSVELYDVVNNVHPTILIGCSTQGGAFTHEVVTKMAEHTERPIIFPLSNPTAKAEARPAALLEWTQGRALIATGSPFDPVSFNGKNIRISQCNNAFVFPGIGMGVIVSKAKHLTDEMLWTACKTLSDCSPAKQDPAAPLLPDFSDVYDISKKIALVVANQARKEGLAQVDDNVDFEKIINASFWTPKYYPYKKI